MQAPCQTLVQRRTLHANDMLDGEGVVLGFTYPVADIFADPLG